VAIGFRRWCAGLARSSQVPISNEIMSHLDWAPTLLAVAGNTDVKEKLLKGYEANGRSYKNHLDGYNFLPYLTGKEEKGPRKEFFYFSDEGDLMALRYISWPYLGTDKLTSLHSRIVGRNYTL